MPETLTSLIYTRFYRAGFSAYRVPAVIVGWYMVRGGGVRGGGGGVLVNLKCWRVSLNWSFIILMEFWRCFCTRLDVRPGKVAKKPASMDL